MKAESTGSVDPQQILPLILQTHLIGVAAIFPLGPAALPFIKRNSLTRKEPAMASSADNDNTTLDDPMVFIIIGKAYEREGDEGVDIHVMLRAPDDDSAVREALNALSEEGFLEADLDQIGTLTGEPEDEPHASAYKGALEGEVAIIRFA
jgi:hypothetical protein